ncbi:hypothetical protein BCV29_16945 [Vibrio cyclitrophicus]|uniref:hypothetical protein n=1 Tax=Vibrio TaxID=662 RepID=UPI000C821687|nr:MULTISPECIES: hypothetical protein [Vibrio]PME75661.1 hypothetical protein BCV29_16745 [Vibrio cyclitrophicus]TCV17994.1 hypothetical protein EDB13_101818 [Vibrio crassostreae]
MDSIVYQLTSDDLDGLIQALIIIVIACSVFGRACSFLLDWIDRLLVTRTIRNLEIKRDFLLSEIGSLNRQKQSMSRD